MVSGAWGNRWFAATVGAFYDWAMQRQPVADAYLRLIVGDDARGLLGAMDAVTAMPDGSSILMCRAVVASPCAGCVRVSGCATSRRTSRRRCLREPDAMPVRAAMRRWSSLSVTSPACRSVTASSILSCASAGCIVFPIRRRRYGKWRGVFGPVAA